MSIATPSGINAADIDDWEHAVALLGPVLHFMGHRERPLRQRVRGRLRRAWAKLRAPDNARWRFGLGAGKDWGFKMGVGLRIQVEAVAKE